MSSRGGGNTSRARGSGSNAASRPSDMTGPSSHRFADRRQERMRGAGTAVAMQREFQFKLPPKRTAAATAAAAAAAAATTRTSEHASTSIDSEGTARKRGRPRGSGPRQKERAAAAQQSFGHDAAAPDFGGFSPPPADQVSLMEASSSVGVARRVARPQISGPISSTPAASRIRKDPSSASAASRQGLVSAQRSDLDQDEQELGSQLGDADEFSGSSGGDSGAAGMIDPASPGDWQGGLAGDIDESLPIIPSPSASSSHIDNSVRRMRPSVGGTSVSRLSIADTTTHADSPAARAAQRNLDARQRRRQASPGAERLPTAAAAKRPRGRPPKSTTINPAKRPRALIQAPSEYGDETLVDRTMVERQARVSSVFNSRGSGGVIGRKEMQKRLKRALTLVFSASSSDPSDAADDDDDDDSSRLAARKKRKSAKYLNDVDIIWSIVDEELRSAIEEQPAKAPFLALKTLRKSIRSNFLNLSEKTDSRTTLISQLLRARRQKRQLRSQVFAKRSELNKVSVEAKEREKEMHDWSNEVKDVTRVNGFLHSLRDHATAWT
ncbi:uncharacterized protein UTRI_04405 [Ustilago trichophora]|uniref:Inner kinetochore subunit AME1 domain-containing protein n=1 Tax=Ustilago trichophora TaxID=86804 RepID=A0A5C3ETR7_9BASI|nr:uncharacterized protein UTRI_04405 [Ustilago trichophora]